MSIDGIWDQPQRVYDEDGYAIPMEEVAATALTAAERTTMGTRWRGLLAPINKPTGDGRRIAPGGFTSRPLPLPLKMQPLDANGHDASVVVGVIDKLDIDEEAGEVWGEGELFDDANPATTPQLAENAQTALALTRRGVIGPSVDPGSAQATAVMVGMDRAPTMAEIQQFCDRNGGQMPPTEMLFTGYEIAGATLVPIPAFAEARPLELLEKVALTAAVQEMARQVLPQLDGSLFLDPQLSAITPLTREDLGNGWTRVYGHIATHDVCHVGMRGACTTAPFSDQDYQTFHRYHQTQGGIELPLAVGRLTAAHGQLSATCRCCPGNDDHACNNVSFGAAVAHHDRMRVLAYGRVGEDEKNNAIWFAGVEAPEADDRDRALLSRRKVSGDWRDVAGNMELTEILVLARREPGFPLPRVSMENGRQRSLTAASPIGAVLEREGGEVSVVDVNQMGSAIGLGVAAALGELGFNPNQRRGPDGKWIGMGGKGSAGGAPGVVDRNGGSRKSEGGGVGAGGRDSGGDAGRVAAPKAAPSESQERYYRQLHDLGMQLVGQGDEDGDFDESDADLDDALVDLGDALASGDGLAARDAASRVADLMKDDWRSRDRMPESPAQRAERISREVHAKIAADKAAKGRSPRRDKYNEEIGAIAEGLLLDLDDAEAEDGDDYDPDVSQAPQLAEALAALRNADTPQARDAAADRVRQMLEDTDLDIKLPAITAAANAGHTGAMVALRPTEQDVARLAVTGGEDPDQLHLTLAYLGEADQISPEAREQITRRMERIARQFKPPVAGDGFAVDVFNPGTANDRDTAIVMGVGGQPLADIHSAAMSALDGIDGLTLPEQHAPWVPHVTLQYTDDLNRVKPLADRVGPVQFDRLRLAFADEVTDIPLGRALTAAEVGQLTEAVADATAEMCAGHLPDDEEADAEDSMCSKCDKMSTECASCLDCTPGEFATRATAARLALRATIAASQLGCCKINR